MRKHCLVVILALLTISVGVSFGSEHGASECNLKTYGKSLENYNNVTYQYSVLKNGGQGTSTVRDWTVFDIKKALIVDNLEQGNYTFNIRSLSPSGAVMYQGSENCFMVGGTLKDIVITLYPQIDEKNKDTYLTVNLLNSASDGLTASVVYENCSTGHVESHDLSPCGTGFSSKFQIAPGHYNVSVFIMQDGVVIGGTHDIVFVSTGYETSVGYEVFPKPISDLVDIATTRSLTVKKESVTTFGWKGTGKQGVWKLDNQTVEKGSSYYQLPTLAKGSHTIEYYVNNSVYSCSITVGGGTTVNILNFRSATEDNACIGYRDKATGKELGLGNVEISGSADDLTDWRALNLEPITGVLAGAEFAEITDLDNINSSQFGKQNPNTSLKVLIAHGNAYENTIRGKLAAIETLILDGCYYIEEESLNGMKTLKNVYIIPVAGKKLKIEDNAFYGCTALEHVYVLGNSSSLNAYDEWNGGSSANTIEYLSELPW